MLQTQHDHHNHNMVLLTIFSVYNIDTKLYKKKIANICISIWPYLLSAQKSYAGKFIAFNKKKKFYRFQLIGTHLSFGKCIKHAHTPRFSLVRNLWHTHPQVFFFWHSHLQILLSHTVPLSYVNIRTNSPVRPSPYTRIYNIRISCEL